MGKLILVALIAVVIYAFYQGWLGDFRGGRGDATACAKARATIQDIESRSTTGGGGLSDPGAQSRLEQAREYVRENCR